MKVFNISSLSLVLSIITTVLAFALLGINFDFFIASVFLASFTLTYIGIFIWIRVLVKPLFSKAESEQKIINAEQAKRIEALEKSVQTLKDRV